MEKERSNTGGLAEAHRIKKDVENQIISFVITHVRQNAPGKTPNEYRKFVEGKNISALYGVWFKKLCDRNISIATFNELYSGNPETVLSQLARIEQKSVEAYLGEYLSMFNDLFSTAKTQPIRQVRTRTTAKIRAVVKR